jgi:hypothetical protein
VLGVAVLLQSALLLQPTHTAEQKRTGAIVHSILNGFAAAFFYAALIAIFVNKFNHNGKFILTFTQNETHKGFTGTHFESTHARLGLITYIVLLLNATVGIVQFYFPNLVGGVNNGKALYKYHRIAGYTFVLLILSSKPFLHPDIASRY